MGKRAIIGLAFVGGSGWDIAHVGILKVLAKTNVSQARAPPFGYALFQSVSVRHKSAFLLLVDHILSFSESLAAEQITEVLKLTGHP
jgi:hypothetical protein